MNPDKEKKAKQQENEQFLHQKPYQPIKQTGYEDFDDFFYGKFRF